MPGNRGEGYLAVSLSSCWKPEIDMGGDILSPYCVSGTVPSSVDKIMSPGLCVCDVVAVPVIPALGGWRPNSKVQVHFQFIVS